MKIKITVDVSPVDLFNAVSLIAGQNVQQHVNRIIEDFFVLPVEIDFDKCVNPQEKVFHLNGFVANIINMKLLMEEAEKAEKEKSKIITLNK